MARVVPFASNAMADTRSRPAFSRNRVAPVSGSISNTSPRPLTASVLPSGEHASAPTGVPTRLFGAIAVRRTAFAASSFAPAKTQARTSATSAAVGCFAFAGGIFGFALPSIMRTRRLASGLPGSMAAPLSPPARSPL